MSEESECVECGGRLDRPGLFGCRIAPHPPPTLPQRIADGIERDLNDRRGLGLESLEERTQQSIRDRWAEIVAKILAS